MSARRSGNAAAASRRSVDVADQAEAARAVLGREVVGAGGLVAEARAVFLEEGASALDAFKHALDPQPQPVRIGILGARMEMGRAGDQAVEGPEEGVVHAGVGDGC